VVRISQLHMKSDTFLFTYMDVLEIPFPSKATFFRRQRNLFCPLVERAWRKEEEAVIAETRNQEKVYIGEDAGQVCTNSFHIF